MEQDRIAVGMSGRVAGRPRFGVCIQALGIIALLATGAHAAENDPAGFVQSICDRAVEILKTADSEEPERRARLRSLFSEGFDLGSIGRFALGRYWRSATPEQRGEFLSLFDDFIVNTYAARFDSYAGETFRILQVVPVDHRDSVVNSNVFGPDGTAFRVDYRVRKTDGGLKIVDVMVEGVSLLATQRSEIASVVNREGMDGLLVKLREKTENP